MQYFFLPSLPCTKSFFKTSFNDVMAEKYSARNKCWITSTIRQTYKASRHHITMFHEQQNIYDSFSRSFLMLWYHKNKMYRALSWIFKDDITGNQKFTCSNLLSWHEPNEPCFPLWSDNEIDVEMNLFRTNTFD